MGVAVACGLVAAFLTASLNTGSAAPKKMKMWVARKHLKQGDLLAKKDINEFVGQVDVDQIPEGVVNDLEKIIDNRLNRTRRVGEPFFEADLTKKEGLRLPEGTYALALKVTAESMAGGFVLPGSKIDLYMSETVKNKIKSSLLMRDILVVAVDTDPSRKEDKNSYAAPTTVTLAVTTKQALEIQLASERGKVRLTLRSDDMPADDTKLTSIMSLPTDAPAEEATPAAIAPEPKRVDVVIATKNLDAGTELTEEKFKDYFTTKQILEDDLPEGAFTNMDDIRKRIGTSHKLARALYAQLPVMQETFREVAAVEPVVKVAPPAPPKDFTRRSVLVIQNGAMSTPQSFQYRDGALDLRDGSEALRNQQRNRETQPERDESK
jgi:pilus assembly protein CpaB